MGMLDNIGSKPETDEKKDYQFASSGIDDFANEFKKPKQEQGIDEASDLDNLQLIDDDKPDAPLDKIRANVKVANATGSLAAMALDGGMSTIIGLFIAKADPKEFKANPEEKETLEEAFAEYVKLKGGEIPPGLAILIVILAIYLPKGANAFQLRKANERIDELEKRNAELEEKLK